MKIAFLNIYSGLVNRGAERSTHELANHLAINHEIYVVCGGKENADSVYKTHIIAPFFKNYPDSSSSLLRKVYLDIWSINILFFTLRTLSILWREKFDVVVPINGGWQTLICRIFTWFTRSKMVVIGRAGVGRDDAWNLFCRPDIFIALTNTALLWAKKKTKKIQIIEIPNGVNLNKFNPVGKKAKISLPKPIVLCVGALTENKRIDRTIQAVAQLKNCSLLVLGKGIIEEKLRRLGSSLLGSKRFMLKDVSMNEMPEYYRVADIFTLVSDTGEAFGNVYLEALAINLPVVATDDKTREEIIGKAGIFVDNNNIEGYASALKKALETDFGDIPRNQAEKFSWDKVILEYEKLFIRMRINKIC